MLRALLVLMIAGWLSSAAHAQAEKRLALLIGNQAYSAEIGRLANPHNDVALMEKTLKGLNFDVATVRDATLGGMHTAVNAYARRVKAAGPGTVAFFYYAGHGAADAGINYLIPVDVKSAEQGDLWDVSLRLTEITRKLKAEAGNATHFVVFDACRNELKLRAAGSRALVQSRGFEPVPQEIGMLIAYATAEGALASDVGPNAGPYANALAAEIVKPGVEAVTMFRNVQRRLRSSIKQEPFLGFNALGDIYLAGPAPDPKTPPADPPALPAPAQTSEAERAWTGTKDTQSIAALEAFIRRFGDTYYGDLAKVRLSELKQGEAAKKTDDARAKAKADADRERQALLQKQEDRKRTEAAATKSGPLVLVVGVYGAPGDGSTSLTAAIKRKFEANGKNLTDRPSSNAYRVEAVVTMGAPRGNIQAIEIDWVLKDPLGKRLGNVNQKNDIPAGSLDGAWGTVADQAAGAAVQGLISLLK